ncbi:MAG TPA: hypothetical protein VFQ61_13070 [Polyangiaceae bacterium]|nr:hypothetical protein [Polyangiaceae bacterium]
MSTSTDTNTMSGGAGAGASTAGLGGSGPGVIGGTAAGGASGRVGAESGGRATDGGQAGAGAAGSQSGGVTGEGGRTASAGMSSTGGRSSNERSISFGTLLDAEAVIRAAQALAQAQANPNAAEWRSKGDQHRSYRFAEADTTAPYRLYVPTTWDGQSMLTLVMFLHGSGANENTYVDQNNKQLINLAQQGGFVLVAPLGDKGAYGNFLRLAAPFGKPDEAAKLMAQVTADSEKTNELSERDVINVLELVLNEYPINRGAVFLTGHSMGSGGTWYIGGKYAKYWAGLAPMSGPFVQESGYPWESVRPISLFVTEGTQAPSLEGSRALRTWLDKNGFKVEYKEVNADHGGMVSLVLPSVFDFFVSLNAK